MIKYALEIFRKLFLLSALLLQLTLNQLVHAQTFSNEIETSNKDDLVSLNMKSVDIKTLSAEVAKITGRKIVVHPEVNGVASIVTGEPISKNGLYAVFLSIMDVHEVELSDEGDHVFLRPKEKSSKVTK